ncbi:putative bicarbonate transporter, IctB family, partial [Escherichia coli]
FNQGFTRLGQLRERLQAEGFWLMAAVAGMLGLLGHGLVDTVWYRPEVNTLWWMMAGIIASFYQPISTSSPEPENPEI